MERRRLRRGWSRRAGLREARERRGDREGFRRERMQRREGTVDDVGVGENEEGLLLQEGVKVGRGEVKDVLDGVEQEAFVGLRLREDLNGGVGGFQRFEQLSVKEARETNQVVDVIDQDEELKHRVVVPTILLLGILRGRVKLQQRRVHEEESGQILQQIDGATSLRHLVILQSLGPQHVDRTQELLVRLVSPVLFPHGLIEIAFEHHSLF